MKRIVVVMSMTLALPAVAFAQSPTHKHVVKYNREYQVVAKKFGKRSPGRNIVKWGMPHRTANDRDVMASLAVFDRMLHPAPAPTYTTTTYSTPAPAASPVSYSGGGGSLPACASESGTNYSTGPDNTNPSGATGRYQIMPGTAAGYNCSLATPAGQDACAQVIYAHQGAGAWTGCGG